MKKIFTLLLFTAIFMVGKLYADEPAITLTTTSGQQGLFKIGVVKSATIHIDWGDGADYVEYEGAGGNETFSHTYSSTGKKIIKIKGTQLISLVIVNNSEDTPDSDLESVAFGDKSNFDQLIELNLANNKLTSLDVSSLEKLELLNCNLNNIANINVSANPELKSLSLSQNPLAGIDITKNTKLESLDLNDSDLEELDISKNSLIKELIVDKNQLASIQTDHLTELVLLRCPFNKIETLELSNSPQLKTLVCLDNEITEIKLHPSISALTEIQCQNNYLTFASLPRLTTTGGNTAYVPQKPMSIKDRRTSAAPLIIDLSDLVEVEGYAPANSHTTSDKKTASDFYLFQHDTSDATGVNLSGGLTDNGDGTYTVNTDKITKDYISLQIRNRAYGTNRLQSEVISMSEMESEIITGIEGLYQGAGYTYSNGLITINADEFECSLLLRDISGKVILTKESKDRTIDISDYLEKGNTYILLLSSKGEQKVFKIIG